jgi:two-component system, chemotaxis family, sensor kinase CheA
MSDFIDEDMQEFVQDFLVESRELIEKVDHELVSLEKTPGDLELLNSVFRAFHTIKGTSSFIGLGKISDFTHDVENILNRLRNEELKLKPEIMDIILESVDIIKTLMDDLENAGDSGVDIRGISSRINKILDDDEEKDEGTQDKKIGQILVENGLVTEQDIEKALEKQEITPKLGELLVKSKKISKKDLDKALSKQKKSQISVEKTMRVEVKRLDELMNSISELVLRRNRLLQINRSFEQKFENENLVSDLAELSNSFDLLTSDIHTSLMKVRMVPVSKVFSKFPRMVRDLSKNTKKKVELHISGEDTELDKSVAEELNDPLLHLIRNAIDHGIEEPGERKRKNKATAGSISLNAFHQGNDIVIEIKDDGKGIDVEKVKEKAIEKKLISKDEAEKMSDEESRLLLFKPGFSTAARVTDISGRGVGMDVVKTNIEKLKGSIEIESKRDQGTAVKLKIPLTLEIMQALIVGIYDEPFAVPLTSVNEIISIDEAGIETIREKEVINMPGYVLPVIRLNNIFNICSKNGQEKFFVIIIGSKEKRLGLMVTEIIGKEEIVIKPLDSFTLDSRYISGATIMGDGHISLVLDVVELTRSINDLTIKI